MVRLSFPRQTFVATSLHKKRLSEWSMHLTGWGVYMFPTHNISRERVRGGWYCCGCDGEGGEGVVAVNNKSCSWQLSLDTIYFMVSLKVRA